MAHGNSEKWRESLKGRKYWIESELDILKNNPEKSAKELSIILGRSEYQVAQKLRKIRGTANRRFNAGWGIPSKELAYFFGGISADGGVYSTKFELSQKLDNREFFSKMVLLTELIFGLKPYTAKMTGSWVSQGIQKKREYNILRVCSNQFLLNLGTSAGIAAKNLKWRDNGDWSEFIDAKFPWVWQDPYFWSFIGGLYDGDGSLARKNQIKITGGIWYVVSFGVKPVIARTRLKDEFIRRGFSMVDSTSQNGGIIGIYLNGGQQKVDEFLDKVQCEIMRKKIKLWINYSVILNL